MDAMEAPRSIGTVLSDIVGDLQQIVRAEVRLAKVEIREEMVQAKRGAMFLMAGAVVLIAGFGLLLLAAVYALATIWPAWLAALVVALGAAVIGGGLAWSGKKQIGDVRIKPEKTVTTIKENLQWAKTRTR